MKVFLESETINISAVKGLLDCCELDLSLINVDFFATKLI